MTDDRTKVEVKTSGENLPSTWSPLTELEFPDRKIRGTTKGEKIRFYWLSTSSASTVLKDRPTNSIYDLTISHYQPCLPRKCPVHRPNGLLPYCNALSSYSWCSLFWWTEHYPLTWFVWPILLRLPPLGIDKDLSPPVVLWVFFNRKLHEDSDLRSGLGYI